MKNIKKIFVCLLTYGLFLLFLMFFSNYVLALDKDIFLLINSISNPILDPFFVSISYAGATLFWVSIIIILWVKKEKKISRRLFLAFIIDTISLLVLKWFFLRPRPFERFAGIEVLGFTEIGSSFPSGHSQRIFSGMFILSSFYKKLRIPLMTFSVLVAFSRIYIGIHYPIDVLIGSLNGIIIGMISLAIPLKRILKKLKLKL